MFNLTRAIYTSRARFSVSLDENGVDPTVAEILDQSRINNHRDRISGALYFADGHFFQVLEGPRAKVERLIQIIEADTRHENMKISSLRRIKRRYFKTWSMKYLPLSNDVMALLKARGYGGFSPCDFDESDINALIQMFAQEESSIPNDANVHTHYYLKPSLFKRLFSPQRTTRPL